VLKFFSDDPVTSSKIDCGDKDKEFVKRVTYNRPMPSRNGKILTGIIMELFDGGSFLECSRMVIQKKREIYPTLLKMILVYQNHRSQYVRSSMNVRVNY
jgi:hypothetical protein